MVLKKLDFQVLLHYRYVNDTILIIPKNKIQHTISSFNSYHPRLQFTHKIDKNSSIKFRDIKVIRNNDNNIITNWYRRHLFCEFTKFFYQSSHKSFDDANLELVKTILLYNNYFDYLIQKYIKKDGFKSKINNNLTKIRTKKQKSSIKIKWFPFYIVIQFQII